MKRIRKTMKMLAAGFMFFAVCTQANAQETSVIASSADTLRLTLQQALEIALSESPVIKIADQDIEIKKAAREEAYAGLFPTADLVGSYSRAIKKQTMSMNLGGQTQKIKMGSTNTWSGGLQISLPIFAPTLYKSINLTKTDIALAVEAARASRLDLENQVTKAYYQLLLSQESLYVLQKSYDNAESNYKNIEAKFNHGLVSEYDKISAEVQMRSIKPSVVSAESGVRLSRLQLVVLMGIDPATNIAAIEKLSDHEKEMYMRNIIADANNLEENSDLKQLDFNTKMLEQSLKIQRTNYLPTLAATFNYMYTSLNENFKISHYQWNPYSTLGLSLSIPLFHASTSKQTKQTKIQIAQMANTRINTERQLKMSVQSYLDNMSASVEQLLSNKEAVSQAQKARMIAEKRYQIGNGTVLELNDSEVALTQAQLVYNQSIYDYLSAKSDLYKTLGRDVVNEE